MGIDSVGLSASKKYVPRGGDGSFNPASAPDYLPRPELEQLQLNRLRAMVQRAYERVSLFRTRMQQRQLMPDDIKSLRELVNVPYTSKFDLRDTYPFGMFASSLDEVVRIHASSGMTGKPTVVGYTRSDMEVWTEVNVRALAACGVHRGDILQNSYGYGLFTGGLGLHQGGEKLGAAVIPASVGNTDRQIMMIRDFGVTAVSCTPTFFLHLIDRAEAMGVDLRKLPLRVGIFGAEPWTEFMRQRIEQEAGIKAYDIYGLSELCGPGIAIECACQNGLHIFEDHFYPEIIHPETLEVLPEGEEGELVLTALTKLAIPMIRYRTRDITALLPGQCECGRTIRRMRRISRRSDDMLKIRGVNVFPSQVEAVLLEIEGTLPHYQLILTRKDDLDQMEVQVEAAREVYADRHARTALHQKLMWVLEHALQIRVDVTLVGPRTIARSEGKAKRVIDKRQE